MYLNIILYKTIQKNFKFFFVTVALINIMLMASCTKTVTADPPTSQLISETVFQNDVSAISAQVSIYASMEMDGLTFNFPINTGLSGDEFTNYAASGDALDIYNNDIAVSSLSIRNQWTYFYKYIYQANSVIEGLTKYTGVKKEVKEQLLGEAYFVRAFCHFYLVNLFGDVPLILTTDYVKNAASTRTAVSNVYQQIISDLKIAKEKLSEGYVSGTNTSTTERVRPNKYAAAALLARVYLYTENWIECEKEASAVLSQSSLYSLRSNLNEVFLKNNTEAIWQLMATSPNLNSYAGGQFLATVDRIPNRVDISPYVLNNFEAGDKRKTSWIKTTVVSGKSYYYPYKYKVGQNAASITEYSTILRLAEVYLIRSEARAQTGNLVGAQSDLNAIRIRAGLTNTNANTKASLLDAIFKERGSELFTELSDRWLEMKRTGRIDAIMSVVKGNRWQSTDKLYPIPQIEILNSPYLTQNPGY